MQKKRSFEYPNKRLNGNNNSFWRAIKFIGQPLTGIMYLQLFKIFTCEEYLGFFIFLLSMSDYQLQQEPLPLNWPKLTNNSVGKFEFLSSALSQVIELGSIIHFTVRLKLSR